MNSWWGLSKPAMRMFATHIDWVIECPGVTFDARRGQQYLRAIIQRSGFAPSKDGYYRVIVKDVFSVDAGVSDANLRAVWDLVEHTYWLANEKLPVRIEVTVSPTHHAATLRRFVSYGYQLDATHSRPDQLVLFKQLPNEKKNDPPAVMAGIVAFVGAPIEVISAIHTESVSALAEEKVRAWMKEWDAFEQKVEKSERAYKILGLEEMPMPRPPLLFASESKEQMVQFKEYWASLDYAVRRELLEEVADRLSHGTHWDVPEAVRKALRRAIVLLETAIS